jgi:hypothetical protein
MTNGGYPLVMSPTPDEFDEGLRTLNLGSRYRVAASAPFRSLYATVEPLARAMRDQLVNEIGASKRVPEILSGVNDDSSFNAIAAPLPGGRYIIAVNYGALILVHDLVHRLFCLPEFFSWVGDPSKEDRARQFHPTSDNAQTYMRMFISDPRSVTPRDPRRKQAAVFLIPFAVMFLVAHEFGHIVGGHLDWLKAQSSQMSISEVLGIQGDPRAGLFLQALEMDADGFAMYYTLIRALAMAESSHENSPTPFQGIITTPLQALEVVLACALVMIGTFFRPPGPPDKWRSYSHPPSGIRHGMNLWGADRALQQLGLEDLRSATTANLGWLSNIGSFTLRHLVRRLGNTDRPDDLRLEFGPPGQQHLLEILNAWGSIQDAVAALAY